MTQKHIDLIAKALSKVEEPYWPLLEWLRKVCLYCKDMNYHPETLKHFLLLMQQYLNSVSFHAIDNSYDTDINLDILLKIHDGTL